MHPGSDEQSASIDLFVPKKQDQAFQLASFCRLINAFSPNASDNALIVTVGSWG